MAEEMPSELKSSVGFAVDDNKAEESSKNEKSAPKKKKSRSSSLRSSFFRLKSLSFRRCVRVYVRAWSYGGDEIAFEIPLFYVASIFICTNE